MISVSHFSLVDKYIFAAPPLAFLEWNNETVYNII